MAESLKERIAERATELVPIITNICLALAFLALALAVASCVNPDGDIPPIVHDEGESL